MALSLDAELDRLFQQPLADLVQARDDLAGRLRKAGDREAAAHVKRIKRPTPGAWALNQLHFREPACLGRVLDRARELRALHAQDGVEPRALWAAMEAQRKAVHEAAEAALALMKEAGLPSGLTQQRKLLASVQGLAAGTGEEPLGRMTRDLEASGFEAMDQVGAKATKMTAPTAPPAEVVTPALQEATDGPDPIELARAQRELARCEARADEAQARREELAAVERQQRQALADTQERLREAERMLAALRAEVTRRETELARAARAVAEVDAARAQAVEALESARAALEALRASRRTTVA